MNVSICKERKTIRRSADVKRQLTEASKIFATVNKNTRALNN